MTYPSKEEIDQPRKRKIFFTWSFAIAILTTILVYSIVNEVIIWITRMIH